jgi:hypothetical protein
VENQKDFHSSATFASNADTSSFVSLRVCIVHGFKSKFHVVNDVHVGNEGIVRALVRVEVLMDVAVREPFGAHVVEMVARREFAPVLDQRRVAGAFTSVSSA